MKKITLLFLATGVFGFSQDNNQNQDSQSKIKVYTTSTTIKPKNGDNGYKWTVKTDFFQALGGEFPLLFEYRIAKQIGLEASAGMTFSYINSGELFDDTEVNNAFDSKASTGGAYRLGFKFYPSDDYDALEGWSFGVQAYSKTMNREYTNGQDGLSTGELDKRNKSGLNFTIAYQVFSDSNIASEFIIGFGFAKINRDYIGAVDSTDGLGNFTTTYERLNFKKTAPNFFLGYRFGFGN
jgi:hypothetical protein